jgi:hypothetical protein
MPAVLKKQSSIALEIADGIVSFGELDVVKDIMMLGGGAAPIKSFTWVVSHAN